MTKNDEDRLELIDALQDEIAAYKVIRNSIWHGVKINGIILGIIIVVTAINALIVYGVVD